MKKEWLSYLRCPKDGSSLTLKNEQYDGEYVSTGLLVSGAGNEYQIRDRVVDFFTLEKSERQKQTIEMFGHEWQHYDQWGWLDDYPSNTKECEMIYNGGLKSQGEASFYNKAPFMAGDLHTNAIILDAGCGNGRHTRISAEKVALVFCVDASEAIYSARKNLADKGNVCFLRADIFNLPFADNTLDASYSIGVMQHTGNARAFMKSLLRVTKENHPITINCYGKGLWSYELFDWSLRQCITRLPKEKQMSITSKIAKFERWMCGRKSRMVQFIRKCIHTQLCIHGSDCIMYDWYAPSLAEHYTPRQVTNLMQKLGGQITLAAPDNFTNENYSDLKRRLFHRSFQFRSIKLPQKNNKKGI